VHLIIRETRGRVFYRRDLIPGSAAKRTVDSTHVCAKSPMTLGKFKTEHAEFPEEAETRASKLRY
jgi:hypothetical protein